MTDLPADRDALLRALLCGDLEATDPAVAARLAADSELAARWDELAAIEGALLGSRATRAEALAAAVDRRPEADDEALLHHLRPAGHRPAKVRASDAPTPAQRSGSLRTWIAAAAMVVVALGAAWYGDAFRKGPEREVPGYSWLGSGGIEIPAALPFGSLELRLAEDAPLDTEVQVRVHALDESGQRGATIDEFLDVGSQPIHLTEAQLGDHPGLEWEIEVRTSGSAVPTVHRFRQMR